MPRSRVHTLRLVTLVEGVSFLFLLGVAMPLKYWAGIPEVVKVVGWLHGVLFVSVCWLLVGVTRREHWPLRRAGIVILAAILPFGPFVIDHRLKTYES